MLRFTAKEHCRVALRTNAASHQFNHISVYEEQQMLNDQINFVELAFTVYFTIKWWWCMHSCTRSIYRRAFYGSRKGNENEWKKNIKQNVWFINSSISIERGKSELLYFLYFNITKSIAIDRKRNAHARTHRAEKLTLIRHEMCRAGNMIVLILNRETWQTRASNNDGA